MKQPLEVRGRIRLEDFDPEFCNGMDKERARTKTLELRQRIGELQQLLYANARNSLLLVFQGMDTSGKDGASRNVLESVNPSGRASRRPTRTPSIVAARTPRHGTSCRPIASGIATTSSHRP